MVNASQTGVSHDDIREEDSLSNVTSTTRRHVVHARHSLKLKQCPRVRQTKNEKRNVVSGRVAGRDASDDFNARGDTCDPPVLKLRSSHGARKRTPSKQNDFNLYYDHPSEDDALYGVAGKPYSTPVNLSGPANDDRAMTTNRGYTRWKPVNARRSPINPDRQPFNDDYNTRDKYNHSPDKDKFKNFDAFVDLLAFDAEFGRTLMKQVTDKQKKRPVNAVTKQLRRCLKLEEKTTKKKKKETHVLLVARYVEAPAIRSLMNSSHLSDVRLAAKEK